MKANLDRATHRKISEGGKYSLRDSAGQILATAKHWNDARKLWLSASVPCKVFSNEFAITAFQP